MHCIIVIHVLVCIFLNVGTPITIYIFKDANFGNTPCWGYEEDCHVKNQFSKPHCIHHHKPWSVHLKMFHLEIKMIVYCKES